MTRVQAGSVAGLAGVLALLGVLSATVGLGPAGWVVGAVCGGALTALLLAALAAHRPERLGPAGAVTLSRAVLACGVAALTADSFFRATPVALLVALTAVALALDGVDGRVARRTGTVTALGARFDMEVDAFLIAVLSVYVAPAAGAWVLAIGAMRYAYVAASWRLPWLRRPTPPRRAAKTVAAVQGVVLAVAASGLLPTIWAQVALAVALVLLVDSFGRDVVWQWRHRRDPGVPAAGVPGSVGVALTVVAGVAVWLALVMPQRMQDLDASAFLRLPVEGLVLVAVALVLPPWPRRVVAALFGLVLAVLVVVKALDMGFLAVLDRRFDPVSDWVLLGPGLGVLGDSIGRGPAIATAIGVGVLVLLLLLLLPLAATRLARAAAEHRRGGVRTVAVLAAVWVLGAVSGIGMAPAARFASTSASDLAVAEVGQLRADLRDARTFETEISTDAFARTPPDRMLTGLRGKDVLLVFVESYGRVAVQDSSFSPGIDAVLRDGNHRLRAAGYSTRSAFMTSPTFGAGSWLAHSSIQSGLWVDSQRRYRQLLGADRLTLTQAFGNAGWRTVLDVPANTADWPEGQDFYHYDTLYDERNVGYAGPAFSYASMPDQYTLDHFRRTELAPTDRPPVMAEIDLVSSHHPWTPLPHLVPWQQVGDGSIFDPMPDQGESPDAVFRDPEAVKRVYGQSIEYSMDTLVSWLETYPDPNLVLVVLGDHQPHTYVTGHGVGHDVPVSVIAQDPDVVRRISGWHWQPGLLPSPDAPVSRMDTFRDRFLTAFGPAPR